MELNPAAREVNMKKGKETIADIDLNTPLAYNSIEFLETHVFTRQITGLLSDDAYAELQRELIRNPKKGKLIVGGGGIRKLRWSLENNRGKSGGIRIIYFYKELRNQFLMLFAYPKNIADDLTDEQLVILRNLAKEFHYER